MASKFTCKCGYTVCTNAFEGHGIYALVTDHEFDLLKEPITTEEITKLLWVKSRRMVECKGCGILYLSSMDSNNYIPYKKVGSKPST